MSDHILHEVVERPWGIYTVIHIGNNVVVKKIVIYPGYQTSLQSHNYRSEHWVIISGIATITVGENRKLVGIDDHVYVPLGEKHRILNETTENVVLIEVQSGTVLREDDIIRYEDSYGRY